MSFIKTISSLALLAFVIASCQHSKTEQIQPVEVEDVSHEDHLDADPYDSLLAQRLGADEYGMKRYVIAFLKTGPNRDRDSLESVELQKAHMKNIGRLAKMGKLALAGPFIDGTDLRGIYVFNVSSIEEAQELTKTDPAIQAGSLVMELHPWYGSAAVMQINDIHNKITKTAI